MVVVVNKGVIKLLPVPRAVPPVTAANQLMVPAAAVALNVTEPESQVAADAGVVVAIVGTALMVATTELREEAQPLAEAST